MAKEAAFDFLSEVVQRGAPPTLPRPAAPPQRKRKRNGSASVAGAVAKASKVMREDSAFESVAAATAAASSVVFDGLDEDYDC